MCGACQISTNLTHLLSIRVKKPRIMRGLKFTKRRPLKRYREYQ
ncbi:hypothetical protein VIMY103929_00830 [Vibrio mytili]